VEPFLSLPRCAAAPKTAPSPASPVFCAHRLLQRRSIDVSRTMGRGSEFSGLSSLSSMAACDIYITGPGHWHDSPGSTTHLKTSPILVNSNQRIIVIHIHIHIQLTNSNLLVELMPG
jgi:hypothetical protein